MKKIVVSLFTLVMIVSGVATAQTRKSLKLVEVFDAGQPQTIVLKLYDDKADVLCYVLMPELASRKQVNSNWIYDANAIGSISCVKQLAAAPAAEIKTGAVLPQSLKSDTTVPLSSSLTEVKPGAVASQSSLKSDTKVPVSSPVAKIKPEAAPAHSPKSDTKAAASSGASKRSASAATRAAAPQSDPCAQYAGQENSRKARQCRLKTKKKTHSPSD